MGSYFSSRQFYDRNHTTHLFVGNGVQDNDHTVFSCKQSGFQVENFHPRTGFVITPTNDGYYQIMDTDHQAFLFVGNSLDNGGDHTVYASPQKFWKDYNDFMNRTSFSFVPAEGGVRILDKKHNSYLFIGNSNEGGDHTMYSVPVNKFNSNQNEWARRTVFDIQGGVIRPPTNKQVKLADTNHFAFTFVGNSTEDNDHTVYGCKQSGFQTQNFHPRTTLVVTMNNEGYYQIMDSDHQAFFFVGNGVDYGGDHTVYACPQNKWKDYNDFMFRTAFSFIPAENGLWRIFDRKHSSYLFVGNDNQGGDHTIFSVTQNKFNSNPGEWGKRTLWELK